MKKKKKTKIASGKLASGTCRKNGEISSDTMLTVPWGTPTPYWAERNIYWPPASGER